MTAASALRTRSFGRQYRYRSGTEVVRVIIAELERAMAAEQRYAELKRRAANAVPGNLDVAADIPRRLFEEFYSSSI